MSVTEAGCPPWQDRVRRATKVSVADILAHSGNHRLGSSFFNAILSTFHIDRNVTKSPTHDHINNTLTLL